MPLNSLTGKHCPLPPESLCCEEIHLLANPLSEMLKSPAVHSIAILLFLLTSCKEESASVTAPGEEQEEQFEEFQVLPSKEQRFILETLDHLLQGAP